LEFYSFSGLVNIEHTYQSHIK